MKVLIFYDSVYGSTEECVRVISKKIEGEVTIKKGDEIKGVDLSEFDKIIIGSPIRFGTVLKPVKKFCKKNLKQLASKPVALFVCCADASDAEAYFKSSFPLELINESFACNCLGGRFPVNPSTFTDKTAIKSARKAFEQTGKRLPNLSKKMIWSFADEVNNFGKQTASVQNGKRETE